jgi:hypothetical protein
MINRRSFLMLAPAAALAGASLLGFAGCLRKSIINDQSPADDELARIVDEYLEKFPEERGLRLLRESLSLKSETTTNFSFARDATILGQIQRDFAEGHTLSLAGWMLSRTEVRVLVLVSLLGR